MKNIFLASMLMALIALAVILTPVPPSAIAASCRDDCRSDCCTDSKCTKEKEARCLADCLRDCENQTQPKPDKSAKPPQ
ncbi:MAG TPA: hypothetical protein DCR97_10145 [Deltaproteobacteria bacterium]|jgi:hypothetical protein|nr:hypothetical protein [Deltaproteobacteria bacterium]